MRTRVPGVVRRIPRGADGSALGLRAWGYAGSAAAAGAGLAGLGLCRVGRPRGRGCSVCGSAMSWRVGGELQRWPGGVAGGAALGQRCRRGRGTCDGYGSAMLVILRPGRHADAGSRRNSLSPKSRHHRLAADPASRRPPAFGADPDVVQEAQAGAAHDHVERFRVVEGDRVILRQPIRNLTMHHTKLV
jgi:hypothetical protein